MVSNDVERVKGFRCFADWNADSGVGCLLGLNGLGKMLRHKQTHRNNAPPDRYSEMRCIPNRMSYQEVRQAKKPMSIASAARGSHSA